jgi:stage II sporulation protein AB (anti-sigma F factor)
MDERVKVPAAAGASLSLRVPPEARYGRSVREGVARFALSHDVPPADTAEFVVAVSEALANAIEHSCSPDTIEISCWLGADGQLLASVVDHGVGFTVDVANARPPVQDLLAERGRGLPIMRRYTDQLAVHSAPGKGTSVTLGRYVRHRP